jgi:hypothetical protein
MGSARARITFPGDGLRLSEAITFEPHSAAREFERCRPDEVVRADEVIETTKTLRESMKSLRPLPARHVAIFAFASSLGSASSASSPHLPRAITSFGLASSAVHRLQAQTNDVSVGLSTNCADVPGSTGTSQITAPIDGGNGTVFYRMIFP